MSRSGKNLSVYLTEHKDGSKWYLAAWRVNGKRVVKATGVPESSGKTAATIEGLKLRHDGGTVKVPNYREYADHFYSPGSSYLSAQAAKGKPLNSAWARKLHRLMERYSLPKWGNVPLNELNAVAVEKWLLTLPLKNQSRNHILYACFAVPLREARREQIIKTAFDCEPFSVAADRKIRDVFTRAELARLFPQNLLSVWGSEKWATIFLLLTTTGIRKGELRALCWKDFHPEDGYLHIERAVKSDETIGPPKKRKAGEGRPVPLVPVVVAALQGWRKLTRFKEADQLIFPSEYNHEKPLANSYFITKLARACKAANIEIGKRNINVHSLRHTYVTLMKASKAQSATMALAGHTTPTMTENYSHLSMQDQKKLLEPERPAIEAVFDFLVRS